MTDKSEDKSKYTSEKIFIPEDEIKEIELYIERDIFSMNLSDFKDIVFKSKRRGLLFPFSIIISAVLISVLIILMSGKILNTDAVGFTAGSDNRKTAESVLLSKFKTDSDKKIQNKEKEITTIREKLDNYNEQLNTLRKIIFAKSRGDQIKDINETAEYSEMSITELEKTIDKIEEKKSETAILLDKQLEEKNKLIEDVQKAETAEIRTKKSDKDILASITEMQEKLERQKNVNSQLDMLAISILKNIENSNFNDARNNISSFNTLISLQSNNDLPEIARRRVSAGKTMELIGEYISLKEKPANNNKISIINDSKSMAELDLLYSRVLSSLEKQEYDEARNNIISMNRLLDHKSSSDLPEIVRRKSDYMRTTEFMEEFIILQEKNITNINTEEPKLIDLKEEENISVDDTITAVSNADVVDDDDDDDDNIAETADKYSNYKGQSALFGKIAMLSNRTISIEPFFDAAIPQGRHFIVKANNSEIANGRIISSSNTAAHGRIEKLKNKNNLPGINNLIYIISE